MMYSLDLSIGNLISGTVKIIVLLNSQPTVTVMPYFHYVYSLVYHSCFSYEFDQDSNKPVAPL